jgi:hypothetical protein
MPSRRPPGSVLGARGRWPRRAGGSPPREVAAGVGGGPALVVGAGRGRHAARRALEGPALHRGGRVGAQLGGPGAGAPRGRVGPLRGEARRPVAGRPADGVGAREEGSGRPAPLFSRRRRAEAPGVAPPGGQAGGLLERAGLRDSSCACPSRAARRVCFEPRRPGARARPQGRRPASFHHHEPVARRRGRRGKAAPGPPSRQPPSTTSTACWLLPSPVPSRSGQGPCPRCNLRGGKPQARSGVLVPHARLPRGLRGVAGASLAARPPALRVLQGWLSHDALAATPNATDDPADRPELRLKPDVWTPVYEHSLDDGAMGVLFKGLGGMCWVGSTRRLALAPPRLRAPISSVRAAQGTNRGPPSIWPCGGGGPALPLGRPRTATAGAVGALACDAARPARAASLFPGRTPGGASSCRSAQELDLGRKARAAPLRALPPRTCSSRPLGRRFRLRDALAGEHRSSTRRQAGLDPARYALSRRSSFVKSLAQARDRLTPEFAANRRSRWSRR